MSTDSSTDTTASTASPTVGQAPADTSRSVDLSSPNPWNDMQIALRGNLYDEWLWNRANQNDILRANMAHELGTEDMMPARPFPGSPGNTTITNHYYQGAPPSTQQAQPQGSTADPTAGQGQPPNPSPLPSTIPPPSAVPTTELATPPANPSAAPPLSPPPAVNGTPGNGWGKLAGAAVLGAALTGSGMGLSSFLRPSTPSVVPPPVSIPSSADARIRVYWGDKELLPTGADSTTTTVTPPVDTATAPAN